MAREAITRLYDVDDDSVVYEKPLFRGKYDHGSISFRAKPGKLIDLDKLHESVWATRLSGGTRSALLSLDVTVAGDVAVHKGTTTLMEPRSKKTFLLAQTPDSSSEGEKPSPFKALQAALADGKQVTSVTGRLEGWTGHWPKFLNKPPPKPLRVFVTDFEIAKASESKK